MERDGISTSAAFPLSTRSKAKETSSSEISMMNWACNMALALSQNSRESLDSFGYSLRSCPQTSRVSAEIMGERNHAQQTGQQMGYQQAYNEMRSFGVGPIIGWATDGTIHGTSDRRPILLTYGRLRHPRHCTAGPRLRLRCSVWYNLPST